jgi:hypothetical protein
MPVEPNETAGEPITVTTGTTIEVSGVNPNWFAVWVRSGLHDTTIYLRRVQLHALRVRLDEIDDSFPPPTGGDEFSVKVQPHEDKR